MRVLPLFYPGTGYSTNTPNFAVADVIDNIKRLIRGEEFKDMYPSYRKFTGDIVKYVICLLSLNSYLIT